MPNHNQDICDMLAELAKIERDAGVMFKYRIYLKAIESLTNHPTRIKSGAEAMKLKYIKDKIAAKIDDFLNNNKASASNNDSEVKSVPKAMASWKSKKIVDYQNRFIGMNADVLLTLTFANVNTIGELHSKGLHLLDPAQKACLDHLDDLDKPISRDEAKKFEQMIASSVGEMNIQIDLVGDYRRCASSFYCLDVLFTDHTSKSSQKDCKESIMQTIKHVLKSLRKAGLFKKEQVFEGARQSHNHHLHHLRLVKVLARLNEGSPYRQVNLHFVTKDMHYCALFFLTGDQHFVAQVRRQALSSGYVLEMDSLRRLGYTNVPGQPIPLASEQELFDYIGVEFVKPKLRNITTSDNWI